MGRRFIVARNKFPEETVKLIIDVSMKLFIEKGYDHTSLQDIINETKLSKGGIYHHFASKEEIFEVAMETYANLAVLELTKVLDNKSLNGVEKLKELFKVSLYIESQDTFRDVVNDFKKDTRLLVEHLLRGMQISAHELLYPAIKEGIEDGTIVADHPKELAEAIVVLVNVWFNPIIYDSTEESLRKKIDILKQFLQIYKIDIIDEDMIQKMIQMI